MGVRVEATYGAAKKLIAAGLDSFNRGYLAGGTPRSFAVTAGEGEAFQGGLMAEGIGEWMHISLLWVDDRFRRQGVGSSLLEAAEIEAGKRGARGILVDTYSFQAPDFYAKHGYSAYGQIDDCPESGMTWYRFKKPL